MSNGKILEAGHYYTAKGPTIWALQGWNILQELRTPEDKSLLLVDDIHPLSEVSDHEVDLPSTDFPHDADYVIRESDVQGEAYEILEILADLPKKKRAKQRRTHGGSFQWCLSGFPITDENGRPNCLLLDAGLTMHKQRLGFIKGLNILPHFYEGQQRSLLHLLDRALPDFRLGIVLYNDDGTYRCFHSNKGEIVTVADVAEVTLLE